MTTSCSGPARPKRRRHGSLFEIFAFAPSDKDCPSSWENPGNERKASWEVGERRATEAAPGAIRVSRLPRRAWGCVGWNGGLVARRDAGNHPARLEAPLSKNTSEIPVDLTVVVPFFNPGDRLFQTVKEAAEVLRATGASFEIVAVSDGSTDGSEASIDTLLSDVVHRLVLPVQKGKGQAVRAGLERGHGDYLGFIDGDGDVPPELLADFVRIVATEHPDIVIGSKRHPDSQVVYPVVRRMYSWGYQQLVRVLFDLDIRDTQAGIKVVRREVLEDVLPLMKESGFAFDLELLALARHRGYVHLVEAPVRIRERFSSTISVRAVLAIFRDTVAIFWRLRVRRAYGPRGAPRAVEPPGTGNGGGVGNGGGDGDRDDTATEQPES